MTGPDDELRAALRRSADAPGDPYGDRLVNADAMLARVRHGARRRRLRRTGAGAVALAAVAAGVTVVVPSLVSGPGTPVADDAPTASASASTVTAAGDTVWATVRTDCATGTCPALARSGDGGQTWDLSTDGALPAAAGHVELAATEDDGWAWTSQQVAASHDGGDTWAEVDLPGGRAVIGIAAGQSRAVAATGGVAASSLAVSPVDADQWAAVAAPIRASDRVHSVFAGGDVLGAVVTDTFLRAPRLLVDAAGAGWRQRAVACPRDGQVLADTDGQNVWTVCLGGASTLVTGSDASLSSSDTVRLPTLLGSTSLVARADGSVLVAGSEGSYVVRTGTPGYEEVDPPAGDPEAAESDSDGYTSAASGGADGADWLVTTGGRLLTSDNGGDSWTRAPIL